MIFGWVIPQILAGVVVFGGSFDLIIKKIQDKLEL